MPAAHAPLLISLALGLAGQRVRPGERGALRRAAAPFDAAAASPLARPGGAARADVSLSAAPTTPVAAPATPFARSDEPLGDSPILLNPLWFSVWGLTPPGPAPAPSARSGKGKAKGGKAKGGKAKAGGFGVAAAATAAADEPSYCELPPPGYLSVVRADAGAAEAAAADDARLAALGEAARETIDALLPETGAVLLRGLPMRSAEAFGTFWRACLAKAPPLEEGTYSSLGPSAGRAKLAGIDTATNVPPEFLLLCHNELCYNPTTVERIALYCVQEAALCGHSLVARNADLAHSHSPAVREFVRAHGGLLYERRYFDAAAKARGGASAGGAGGAQGSWQEKCSLPADATRADAEAFFARMGFTPEQLSWDEDGGLVVSNVHPGYVRDPASGEEMWWNIAHTGSIKAADGTPFPKKLVAEIQRTGWEHTYAFKLLAGDWLVLDNIRMQHGRLPYMQEPERPRTLLTVYSTPMPSSAAEEC